MHNSVVEDQFRATYVIYTSIEAIYFVRLRLIPDATLAIHVCSFVVWAFTSQSFLEKTTLQLLLLHIKRSAGIQCKYTNSHPI
eukprot:6215051-Amphidinium_carterae.1